MTVHRENLVFILLILKKLILIKNTIENIELFHKISSKQQSDIGSKARDNFQSFGANQMAVVKFKDMFYEILPRKLKKANSRVGS